MAASNGNIKAKIYLANCYRLGRGVEKNKAKAFESYEILAKPEIVDAQLQLGNCFSKGVGTEPSKKQASDWYAKAAINESIIAKYILEQDYNIEIDIRKNKKRFYNPIYSEGL